MLLRGAPAGLLACAWLSACGGVHPAKAVSSPASGEAIRVKVEGPRGVELWSAAPAPARVCAAPCEATLPAGVYEARVTDLPDSPLFELPRSARGAVVEVRPGPKVMPGLAAVTTTVGAATLLMGGAFALADVGGNRDLTGAALPGGITAIVGGGVLAAGLVFVALSGTHVQLREALSAPTRVHF